MKTFTFITYLIALISAPAWFGGALSAQQMQSLTAYNSSDGIQFGNARILQDSADAPSLTRDASGTLYLAYENYAGSAGEFGKIAMRTSTDGGQSWSARYLPVFTGIPGPSQDLYDPTLTITASGDFRMYVTYCPQGGSNDSSCNIYSALSSDGIHFTFEQDLRFGLGNQAVKDAAVAFFQGQWQLCAPIGTAEDGAFHATSADGISFTLSDTAASNATHLWRGNLLENGGSLRFYGSPVAPETNIWWKFSPDGQNWSGFSQTNVPGEDPAVLNLSSGDFLLVTPSTTILSGILPQADAGSLNIWPNPAADRLYFEAPAAQDYVIYDLSGRERLRGHADGHSGIDLSLLESGAYVFSTGTAGQRRIFLKE